MRIQIITPFDMQWVEGYKKVFEGHDVKVLDKPELIGGIHYEKPDVMMFMWMDGNTRDFINNNPKKCKYIVFCRRYELYAFDPKDIQWDKVDKIIFVNDYLAEIFKERTGVTPEVIYNGVDVNKWTYKERGHGNKIAWVGYINKKKNLPLALQIMAELPRDYELHIAGDVQCNETMDYLMHLGEVMKIKVFLNSQVDDMDTWLEDKNYLLSTAISEGSPNNVIEAMAKGIKPIVHAWPGAKQQFGIHVFNTVEEAVEMIESDPIYDSRLYFEAVNQQFGWNQYKRVAKIVEEAVCVQG